MPVQRSRSALLLAAMVLWPTLGCFPEVEDLSYLVAEPRILAIRGWPAEARPNTSVRYESLVAVPGGMDASMEVQYSYCTEPRQAQERTGVSATCLRGESLADISVVATTLPNACALFGPNTPPVSAGEKPRRPADPDPSGGYFLPVRASLPSQDTASFGFQRIHCDLAGATREIFDRYRDGYRDNQHPETPQLRLDENVLEAGGEPIGVPAQTWVSLRAEVSAGDFENYLVYSPQNSALYNRAEVLTSHFYVSDGRLQRSRVDVHTLGLSAETQWLTPATAGPAQLWVVLRDSRGGASWVDVWVEVMP